METNTSISRASRIIVTLEEGATISDVRKALLMIRGIASVRVDDSRQAITPSLRAKIKRAREESESGETIVCATPEAMQQYFDSL